MQRLLPWLKLKTAPEVGFITAQKLIERYGEPQNWEQQSLAMAKKAGLLSSKAFEYLASDAEPPHWQRICKLVEQHRINYTTILDDDYPALLKNIYTPPLILYYRGDLAASLTDWMLSVVGTRKPSGYGKVMTEQIIEPVAKAGVCIISGLAYGIDTQAHLAALKAKGKTIAVLAHGLEHIYPPQNRELAERIITSGAIISEYEPGTKMERWNFPTRNRLISGLSHAVAVMEGALTSGAILTAKFALEQNRDLFALPGQVNAANAQGPNHLIKRGAKLITCGEDILEEFGITAVLPEQTDIFPELTESEQQVFGILREQQREIGFDEFLLLTGFSIGQLSIALLNLELKNLILKSGSAYALK